MAYRQFGRGSANTFTVKPARCPENQHLTDLLQEKLSKVGNSNYSHTLRKAANSIVKHGEPITCFKEALALNGIGNHVANMLFPTKKGVTPPSPASSVSSNGSRSKKIAHRKRPPPPAGTSLSTIAEKPTNQQIAYEQALNEANLYKTKQFLWKVVLLIDLRERHAEHMVAKCQMSGIPCEQRPLPIGDMAWIAQGLDKNNNIVTELMLGTIIERKTTEDLKSSLFGTRYNEQQLRLKHSGVPQILFLIEGDVSKDLRGCPAETIHSAMHQIRLQRGFSIVQTQHIDDTVRTLKRMHRRVVQRSFPESFYDQALPDFQEVDRRRSSGGEGRRRKGRRRLSSLMEMTFDTNPHLLPDMDRFVTYKELKAKVELDRHMGTRTTGGLYAAMLKQVASFSDRKITGLCREYSTMNQLFRAYHYSSDKPNLVKDVPISNDTEALRKTGPKSSQELFVAFCTGGKGVVSLQEEVVPETTMFQELAPLPTMVKKPPPDSFVAKQLPADMAAWADFDSDQEDIPRASPVARPASSLANLARQSATVTQRPAKVPSPICIDLLSSDSEDDRKPMAKRKVQTNENQAPAINCNKKVSSPTKKQKAVPASYFDMSDEDSLDNEIFAKKQKAALPKSPEVVVID